MASQNVRAMERRAMRAIWGAAAATALTLAAVLMAAAPGRVHSAASAIVQAALELRSRLV